jgi:formylglycine-generating enzyme required for sulfatase activity
MLAAAGWGAATPAAGTVFRDCPECPEMVVIAAGEFQMGTPAEIQVPTEIPAELDPVQVRIGKSFAMGRYEITRAAFAREAKFIPAKPHCRTWIEARQAFRDLPVNWDAVNIPAKPEARHPATCLDWHDSQAYVADKASRSLAGTAARVDCSAPLAALLQVIPNESAADSARRA